MHMFKVQLEPLAYIGRTESIAVPHLLAETNLFQHIGWNAPAVIEYLESDAILL
ncbi:hypothetical protein D3C80_1716960 [compost metagenome]